MSRILLADHSPNAQRLGERILRDEGAEVVTVTDGDSLMLRLTDVEPDLIIAEVSLPKRDGYEICRYVRADPRFAATRVVLTAGALDEMDADRAKRMGADATLHKPFEASALLDTVRPLLEYARKVRASAVPVSRPDVDVERIRAAVTLALDAAMPAMINELTGKVIEALKD